MKLSLACFLLAPLAALAESLTIWSSLKSLVGLESTEHHHLETAFEQLKIGREKLGEVCEDSHIPFKCRSEMENMNQLALEHFSKAIVSFKECESHLADNGNLREEVKALKDKKVMLASSLEDEAAALAKALSHNKKVSKDLTMAKEQLADKRKEISRLEGENNQLGKALATNKGLSEALASAIEENANNLKEIGRLNGENTRLKEVAHRAGNAVKDLTNL